MTVRNYKPTRKDLNHNRNSISVAKQFTTTWKEESQVPPVIKIYKVVNPKKVEEAYEDYK